MKKRLVWVPNLFTLGNLTLGFISMAIAVEGVERPHLLSFAGFLVLLAVLFDGLDGTMARLLDARSALGAQLDSLADLATFGLAPAVVMYVFVLRHYTMSLPNGIENFPIGMVLAAPFPALAAYRLARFNVEHDDSSFKGLPSPIAGLIVALMPALFYDFLTIPSELLVGIYLLVAFLMVSTVRYSKPQTALVRRFTPMRFGVAMAVIFGFLGYLGIRYGFRYSAAGLFMMILIYIISGFVSLIIHAIQELRV